MEERWQQLIQWKKDRQGEVRERKEERRKVCTVAPCTKRARGWAGGGAYTKCQGGRGVSRNQLTLAGWAKDEQRTPRRSSLGEMDGKPAEPGILEAGEAGNIWKIVGAFCLFGLGGVGSFWLRSGWVHWIGVLMG